MQVAYSAIILSTSSQPATPSIFKVQQMMMMMMMVMMMIIIIIIMND
jgi:hypothetical protein